MMRFLLVLAMVAAGCGEDEGGGAPGGARPPGGGGKGAAKPKGKGKELKPMLRIEDRVTCPTPSDAKKCDPKAPTCGAGSYCIAAAKEHYCGPCPERDAIRHQFKPRDFQGADIRDPFQSFVISQPGLGKPTEGTKVEQTPKCTRKDQFVASTYNYQQLKLVGVVSQGTQRKVLMMGGNLGYIIKKGDCVGKEKAVVKDIGAGFVTFQLEVAGKSDPVEYSMQLYPIAVAMGSPDAIDPGAASAPIVAPPSQVAPPAPAPAAGSATGPQTTTTIIEQKPTTTTVIQQKPPAPTVAPPKQAPTEIKP